MRSNNILLECGWLRIGFILILMRTVMNGRNYGVVVPASDRQIIVIKVIILQSILHLIIESFHISSTVDIAEIRTVLA